jgi:hypothetical protein
MRKVEFLTLQGYDLNGNKRYYVPNETLQDIANSGAFPEKTVEALAKGKGGKKSRYKILPEGYIFQNSPEKMFADYVINGKLSDRELVQLETMLDSYAENWESHNAKPLICNGVNIPNEINLCCVDINSCVEVAELENRD